MKRSRYFKWGIILLIICVAAFLSIPVVAFLKIANSAKVAISAVLFVIGEATFWAGGILLGKELLSKYIARFNPKNWFKRKPENKDIASD